MIAFDLKLMRPACVLVAAGMGADAKHAHAFDTQDWLLAPTPDMKLYPDPTPAQLQWLVQKVETVRKNG